MSLNPYVKSQLKMIIDLYGSATVMVEHHNEPNVYYDLTFTDYDEAVAELDLLSSNASIFI